MRIDTGSKQFNGGPSFVPNKHPDLLWFAGAKNTNSAKPFKIRISLIDSGTVLKVWAQTVEHLDDGGTLYGNMFEGFHVKSDAITMALELKVEIDSGFGYKEYEPTDTDEYEKPPIWVGFNFFTDGAHASAVVGVTLAV